MKISLTFLATASIAGADQQAPTLEIPRSAISAWIRVHLREAER